MDEKCKTQCINKNKSKLINVRKTLSSNSNIIITKHRPTELINQGKLHIRVTRNTNFKGLLNKCNKLLYNDFPEIVIHGLGAAVEKACNLALRLKEIHQKTLELDIKTSTVELKDDIKSFNGDQNDEINLRRNSAIHIRLFRKESLGIIHTKKK